MKQALVYITLLFSLSCEFSEDKNRDEVFFLSNIKPQTFEIDGVEDTTITSSKGTRLIVGNNAFLLDGNAYTGKVKLELTEVLSRKEMVLAGLSTRATNGELLDSGGMIKVLATSLDGKELELIKGKLKAEIPANGIKSDMMLFTAQEDNNGELTWEMNDSLPSTSLMESIEIGKGLYEGNCIQCHAILDEVVGPRLGNITERRSNEWLLAFTKYPECMIRLGDSISVCLYEKYQQYMPNHDFLSDEEINSIYTYIENESKLSQTYLDSLDLVDTLVCKPRFPITDPRYFKTVNYSILQDEAVADCTIEFSDSLANEAYKYMYPINFQAFGWINVDRFFNVHEPVSFFAYAKEHENYKILQSALVLYNYNSVMSGYVNAKGLISFNSYDIEGKTPLPKDEPVLVIVVARDENGYLLGVKEIKVSEGVYKVDFETVSKESLSESVSYLIDDFLN